MTVCPGAAVLMSRHSASAASSSERTLTRAEIFFEKIRVHPAARNATNWLSSSWPLVEQSARPIRSGGACHGAPGRCPGGTGTSSRSDGMVLGGHLALAAGRA